jgi:hypothetical protein
MAWPLVPHVAQAVEALADAVWLLHGVAVVLPASRDR